MIPMPRPLRAPGPPGARLLLCALLALGLGCTGEAPPEVDLARPVVVTDVSVLDLRERIQASGELRAEEEAEIASEVAGRVTELHVDEGFAVEAGDVLLEIDPERRELELRSARAQRAEAEAAFREAAREAKRVATLHERGIAADARLDQVSTERDLARSRLEAARARVGVAERALRDSSVQAPFAGLVARRHVSRGEYVQTGQVLYRLVAVDPVEVDFTVPERDSDRVVKGQVVAVTVSPFPEESFEGRVSLVSPTIDPATRTLRVEARIPNPEGRLRPGLFARVDLGVADRQSVVMVPEEAVLMRADGQVVFRANAQGQAERVTVETGVHRDGLVEIARGLRPGDRVVTRGQADLVDGAPIAERQPDGSSEGASVAAKESAERDPVSR